MKIIDQVSKATGKTPEVLVEECCVNDYCENADLLCGGSCEACWNQEEPADPNVLVTVTDEEAERMEKVKGKLKEALELSRKAEQMEKEAFKEKALWFAELEEKYGIKGNLRFDPETKTLRRMEKTDERPSIAKVIGMLVGMNA